MGRLLEAAKSGSYHAPPVKRVWIPKGDGQQRPIGIPTCEDKVLQRAVAMVLEAVFEQDFYDSSFGAITGKITATTTGGSVSTATAFSVTP